MTDDASWAGLRQRAEILEVPLIVHLELTSSCTWNCLFCSTPPVSQEDLLKVPEWLEVLDDLRELGTLQVVLTGGEPLASPDFFEVARAACAQRFAIRIFSNLSLVDESTAAAIAELRPLVVEASLHGANAAVHDRFTQQNGSFDLLWEGVERLQRHGVRLLMKTPVTCLIEEDLDDLVGLAKIRGVPLRFDLALAPRGDGAPISVDLDASPNAQQRLMERMWDLDRLPVADHSRSARTCGAGRTTLAIDPAGMVLPCVQWRSRVLGNVRTDRLTKIWRQSQTRATVQQIAESMTERLETIGPAEKMYPYCVALAEQLTGDPFEPDSGFLLRSSIAAELRREL